MTDQAAATPAADAAPLPPTHVAGGSGELTLSDAVRSYTDFRRKQEAGANEARAEIATPEKSEAAPVADDATPPQEATGETQDANPVEEPPLERPRSWSKEREAVWTKLDRDTQQYLLDHDSEVSKGVRKAQNEAAELRKAADAERTKAEQARQQYEAAYPQLQQAIESYLGREYPDIKTAEDARRLSAEDPLRYLKWRADQDQIAAATLEAERAQQRQAQEKHQKLSKFSTDEDAKFLEKAPDLTDKKRKQEVADGAVNVLRELGFSDEELGKSWMGEQTLSLRDHRVQLLIKDAVEFRESKAKIEAAAKAAAKRELPPVQRPGAGKPANSGAAQQLQILEKQLANASGMRAARLGAQITALRRQAG